MPTILTVTDFSENSTAAVQYAAALAQTLECDLHLLHTYVLPIAIGDQPMPLMGVDEMESIARNRMEKLASDLAAANADLYLTHQIAYGDWRDAVTDDTGKEYQLIVIGSDGQEDSWMGSDAQDAALDFERPVLVVPPQKMFSGLQTICLACDATSMESAALLQNITPILKSSGARLELLHVNTGAGDTARWNEAVIGDALAGCSFSLSECQSSADAVDKAIHEFALAKGADWLALIPHHYSFFGGLFHNSHTRAAMKWADLPVLSLH